MITTKGIIEKVQVSSDTNVVQYRVRIPMFHEVEGASEVSTNQLPLAIYPTPPHMEKTVLKVGDLVEVTLEDGGLDTVVILGMLPFSQMRGVTGSDETSSQVIMEKVNSISFDKKGSVVLPYNTRLRMDDYTEDVFDGDDSNYVTGEELSYIKGLNEPLMQKLEALKETIDYLEKNLIRLEVRAEMIEEGESDSWVDELPTTTQTSDSGGQDSVPSGGDDQGGDDSGGDSSWDDVTEERMRALFPNGIPTTKNEMQNYLQTITVPIWDSDTQTETTTQITVHKDLVNDVQSAFREMADLQFNVKPAPSYTGASGTYGYWFRHMNGGGSPLSYHSYGVAVDVNYITYPRPSYANGVVDIWKRKGWFWGGDWTSPVDTAHFCYVDH